MMLQQTDHLGWFPWAGRFGRQLGTAFPQSLLHLQVLCPLSLPPARPAPLPVRGQLPVPRVLRLPQSWHIIPALMLQAPALFPGLLSSPPCSLSSFLSACLQPPVFQSHTSQGLISLLSCPSSPGDAPTDKRRGTKESKCASSSPGRSKFDFTDSKEPIQHSQLYCLY